MSLTSELFGDVLVAHTPDELNEDTSGPFHAELIDAADRGRKKFVLQMDRTEAYDSAGLTALLDLQDEVREAGAILKISGLDEPGNTIFKLTRLDRRFDIFDSVIDAVQSFR
ncbi:STAS domain-containing protein [Stratiformator vulcanicus]|uniref:STAS domain protein n=1 Tax=Stratiformator vulcanicus TaxID=2527980 RepID=A0A517QYM8_9PLAN|nr:STAS domain-containing protein [Stratiformator vulcanicus]QDT36704.1 STAS domain protein [Stratiformator vulcanicus]